ncbi:Hypothetical predicted protein [Olea europaea subsp. europaea]|uniref:Uncharacterized protein n=1 Tax=Olea europaea subsp. europaea TaxID=158383 RepID=A0A8S0TKR7_OLEEU|nr:Hypothetical predicted protein [Olea europaea subsp. europaea]
MSKMGSGGWAGGGNSNSCGREKVRISLTQFDSEYGRIEEERASESELANNFPVPLMAALISKLGGGGQSVLAALRGNQGRLPREREPIWYYGDDVEDGQKDDCDPMMMMTMMMTKREISVTKQITSNPPYFMILSMCYGHGFRSRICPCVSFVLSYIHHKTRREHLRRRCHHYREHPSGGFLSAPCAMVGGRFACPFNMVGFLKGLRCCELIG